MPPSRRATRLTSIFSPIVALAPSSRSWTVCPSGSVLPSRASASVAPEATAWSSTCCGQGAEPLALGDEVGLAEDLDDGADAAGGGCRDQPVGGRTTLALGDALEALDPQDLLGLGHVAVGLVEGLLDVHHAGSGELAELLDVSGGVVRHVSLSLLS